MAQQEEAEARSLAAQMGEDGLAKTRGRSENGRKMRRVWHMIHRSRALATIRRLESLLIIGEALPPAGITTASRFDSSSTSEELWTTESLPGALAVILGRDGSRRGLIPLAFSGHARGAPGVMWRSCEVYQEILTTSASLVGKPGSAPEVTHMWITCQVQFPWCPYGVFSTIRL